MNREREPDTVHEQLQLSLFHAERTPYVVLDGRMEHGHWAVSHVQKGSVWTAAGGTAFHASAGSVMVHPPHLSYTERGQMPGIHEWLVFEATAGPHLDLLRLHPIAPVIPLSDPEQWSQTFDRLLTLWRGSETPFRALRLQALIADLLTELVEIWYRAGATPRPISWTTPEDRFAVLIHYLTEHLSEPLTRDRLAARACLHPASLDRAFRQVYGVTPMKMLRDMRLEQARRLMESTDWSLAAIADACGLEDAAYLGRVFRRRFGQSPGEYRQVIQSAKHLYTHAVGLEG